MSLNLPDVLNSFNRNGNKHLSRLASFRSSIPVFPLTRLTLFFVPTLQFLLLSRKQKEKKEKKKEKRIFMSTDPNIFQETGQATSDLHK